MKQMGQSEPARATKAIKRYGGWPLVKHKRYWLKNFILDEGKCDKEEQKSTLQSDLNPKADLSDWSERNPTSQCVQGWQKVGV